MADNNTVWKWGNQQKYHTEIKEELDKKLEETDLANVALSGSYNDLTDIPKTTEVMNTSETSSLITLTDAAEAPLLSLKAYGRSWQNTEPSAETPADISSIGDSGNLTITVCGKNLFPWNDYAAMSYSKNNATSVIENNEFVITCKNNESQAKGVYISSSIINDTFKNYNGQTLTASAEFKMESEEYIGTTFHFGFQDSGRVLVESTGEWQKISVTMNFDASLTNHFTFYAREYSNTTFAPVFRVRNIQLEIGDTASGYEPYHSSSAEITTGLPLRGIPVDSDGNYTDENGQEWICDELFINADGTGKIIKNISKSQLSSANNWTVSSATTSVDRYYASLGILPDCNATVKPYCTHFNRDVSGNIINGISINETSIGFAYATYGTTTVDDFKNFLDTNDVYVIYAYVTSIETELTSDEVQSLLKLQTYDGVTNVFNTDNADMFIKYWCDDAASKLLETKADKYDLTTHISNNSNPHNVTKNQINLENVENKSSETIRSEITKKNVTDALGYTPPESDTVYVHPESGVTAGTYQTVTVDAKGHVTAGSNAIMQTNSETNSNFRLLLSGGANDTTQGSSINKSANFTANPSTGVFYAKGFARISIGGKTLDINDFTLSDGTTDSMYYIVKTSSGASNIANIPIANAPFVLDVHLIRYGSETDYITMQKFISTSMQQNEYVRYCTSGTWSEWVKRNFTEYTHPNSGVNSGTYSTVTVNSQGHITAGWQGIKQTPSEADSNFRLLLSGQANDTEQMTAINKSVNFTANPFTGAFYAKGFNRIDISAEEVDINTLNLSDGASHSMHYIVTNDTGSVNKPNIPIANRAFILDVYLIRYSDETDYITAQRFVTSGDMNNEYIRYCTNGVWSEWYKQFLISSESVMQSKLVAESNTGYTVPQVRNITMSTEAASGGNNGQVHFQYV